MCIKSRCLLSNVVAVCSRWPLSLCNLRSRLFSLSPPCFPNFAKRTSVTWCLLSFVLFFPLVVWGRRKERRAPAQRSVTQKQQNTTKHIKQNEARTNQTNLATLPQTSLVIPPIMRNSSDLGNTRVILATPLAILAPPVGNYSGHHFRYVGNRGWVTWFLYRRVKQRNTNKTCVRFEKKGGRGPDPYARSKI